MLYRSQPRQAGNCRRSAGKYTQGILKTNCGRTRGGPSPLASVRPAGGLATTCRIPARARAPFPCARSLGLRTWNSRLEAAQVWGLRLRGSGVSWGDETLLRFPPPPEESHLGLGGRVFSSCAQAARGPRLASRVPQRRRALSLWPGDKRGERLQISQGEEWKEPKHPCEACAHRPPYPKSGATGARDPAPGAALAPGPASSGGRERALPAIFGPNRHAPQIQAGGAGLEQRH